MTTATAALDTVCGRRIRVRPGHAVVRRACMLLTVSATLARPIVGSAQQPQATPPADVHEHVSVTAQLLTPTRETSGTAWLPQATPMYGVHRPWRGWDLRLNGVIFLQAIYEPGDRHRPGGASTRQGGSNNWGMAMARRNLGGGRVGIRTMFSAEPWTVAGCSHTTCSWSWPPTTTVPCMEAKRRLAGQSGIHLPAPRSVAGRESCRPRGPRRCRDSSENPGTPIARPRWPTRPGR